MLNGRIYVSWLDRYAINLFQHLLRALCDDAHPKALRGCLNGSLTTDLSSQSPQRIRAIRADVYHQQDAKDADIRSQK